MELPDQSEQLKNGLDEENHISTYSNDPHTLNINKSPTVEKEYSLSSSCGLLVFFIFLLLLSIALIVVFSITFPPLLPIPCLMFPLSIYMLCKFTCAKPNEARVITYCGEYVGTSKQVGLLFLKPCHSSTTVSLKSEHYNGGLIKVNEKEGNPVLLGVIVIWRVKDTAKVIFDVRDYRGFISTQVESAVRFIGCKYPYEPSKPGEVSLRGGQEEINRTLKEELSRRVYQVGLEIEDARVTEISLGPEVAEMLLKKQAAKFVSDAKMQIVKGAVDSVEESLKELHERGVCNFSQEEKNKYVSQMMMILCMENNAKPLIKV